MKAIKRTAAAVLAVVMSVGFASCGSKSGGDGSSSSMPEKKLEADQQDVVDSLAEDMETRTLENSEIKWFSFYDINPTASEDKEIGADLALFQTKYNGKITYIQTTWDTKFDDLAAKLMANDSPDFVGADDMDMFPRGAIKNMIQPLDDYIDFDSALWADMKSANDQFVFKGSHYVAVSRVDPSYIWIYNKNVIADNGLDDPAELYAKGEWNWDTMSAMCKEFVDADADKWALDGWYYENALTESSGKALIAMENGNIVNNIESPEIAKAQNMMYDLQKNNVVYPKHERDWKVRGDVFGTGIASGLTLFYPIGLWAIEDAPSVTEPYGDLSAGEVMFVPVPCAADSDAQYVPSRIHGFCICKGAKNPEGVAAWMDCTRYAETDADAHAITIQQYKDKYGWTDEMLEMREEIYAKAAAHPVFEFATGVSQDISNITDGIIKKTMHPGDPAGWAQTVEENKNALDYLIEEAQSKIE
ncbi:extracellular solute-binding protein [Ruminococcus sp. YE71]|uniref:ABC transporter substrate-binding protein n=1 Tax=unclassified Ruminococcus TaxID=2608920 RepID=UPI00087F284C|nr:MULTISPECIES: extracellular solute-binding protein [unclassified Ruminococcus]SDA09239.1 extracellular solute-binding protein [Ruminococcus sp. YE78]SFW12911.1 extracellular solute-binding protein [Ruminococcus sp. YE71]